MINDSDTSINITMCEIEISVAHLYCELIFSEQIFVQKVISAKTHHLGS